MEAIKVFVELFDSSHEQKPRRRDFYFAPTVTIADIKQEVENFLGISDADVTVLVDGRPVASGSLLRASGGVSLPSKLRINYKIKSQISPSPSKQPKNPQRVPDTSKSLVASSRSYTYLNRDEDFICPICHDLVLDPIVLSKCEHMFCSGCLAGLSVELCPLDQEPFTEAEKKPPVRIIRTRIEEARVKCNACGVEMKRGLRGEFFSRHSVEECPQPCTNLGCRWNGPHSAANWHLANECRFHSCNRADDTGVCNFKGTRLDVEKHWISSCEYGLFPCPHGCEVPLLRKLLSAHEPVCRIVLAQQKQRELDRIAAIEAKQKKVLDDLNPSSDTLIHLNVSGRQVVLSERSIERSKGSVLYLLLRGSRSAKRDGNGLVFVDRPFAYFSLIVDWLQTGCVPSSFPRNLDPVAACVSKEVLDGALFEKKNLQYCRFCEASLRWAVFKSADLRHADLTSADLSYADLRQADLSDSVLAGVNLSGAQLSYSNFTNARLSGANLSNADLSNANFRSSSLGGVDFTRANLAHADFSHGDLSKASFRGADLKGAVLVGCKLRRVSLACRDLSGCDLSNCILSDADLSYCNLDNANLSNTNFINANLSNATIRNANLRNSDLSYSNLSNADLSGSDATNANMNKANLSNATMMNTNRGMSAAPGPTYGPAVPPSSTANSPTGGSMQNAFERLMQGISKPSGSNFNPDPLF